MGIGFSRLVIISNNINTSLIYDSTLELYPVTDKPDKVIGRYEIFEKLK